MVQREIADRLRAAPGSRTYGSPSVVAQLACEVELLRTVDPAVFRPRPRVDSAILAPAPHRARRRPGDPRAGPRRLRPPPQVAGRARSSTSGRARSAPAAGGARASSACPRTPAPRRSRPRSSPPCRRSCAPAPDAATRCSIHAPAKLNLCLYLGPRRDDGLHELCSLFEPLALADLIEVDARRSATRSSARGSRARTWPRGRWRRCASAAGSAPPLRIEIEKRIPVAAGLGGGSADAAAVLRLAARRGRRTCEELAARARRRRALAAASRRWRWCGAPASGSSRCPSPAPHAVVLLPGGGGLSTAEVFAEADRLGLGRDAGRARASSPARLREAAGAGASPLAYPELLVNDLEPAARSLRPEIGDALDALREAGAAGRAADAAPARPRSASSPTSPPPRGRRRALDRDDAIVCEAGRAPMKLPGGGRGRQPQTAADRDRRRGRRRRLLPRQPRARPTSTCRTCWKTSPTRSAPGPTCWSASSPSPRPAPSSASSSPARR